MLLSLLQPVFFLGQMPFPSPRMKLNLLLISSRVELQVVFHVMVDSDAAEAAATFYDANLFLGPSEAARAQTKGSLRSWATSQRRCCLAVAATHTKRLDSHETWQQNQQAE